MDAFGRIRVNDRGFAVVYLAIMIVILAGFVSLGIDLGYMYFARGQLQNATDASALAGAANLDKTNSPDQVLARGAAQAFANVNHTVPNAPVQIASDGTNVLDVDNDITVGNWNSNASPKYLAGRTPINAVQVRARRTADSPGGTVGLFFGNAFGIPSMNAGADAIAARTASATSFFALCADSCGTGLKQLQTGKNIPAANAFAWSSLLVKPTAPGFSLNDLVCGATPNEEICGEQIYTSMGADNVSLRHMESVMFDPLLDAANKDKDATGNVTGWSVTVPLTVNCPPGGQGNTLDPATVYGYARVHILAICATGGGNPCGNGYSAPQSLCRPYGNNVMVVDNIECHSCSESASLDWLKPVLKK